MKQYWIRVLHDMENSCRSRRLLSSTFIILHSHTQPHSVAVIIKLRLCVINISCFWTTFLEVFLADNWNTVFVCRLLEQKENARLLTKRQKRKHFDEGFSWLRLSQSKVKKKTGALIGSLRCQDGDGDKNVKKKKVSLEKQNWARAAHSCVHFLAVTADYDVQMRRFHVLCRTWTSDDEIFFLFLMWFLGIQLHRRVHLHLTK